MPRIDLTGQIFGRYTVLSFSDVRGTHSYYLCRCECGVEKTIKGTALTNGDIKSCGCYRIDLARESHTIHGHATIKNISPEFITWSAIKARCESPTHTAYKYYGGRGITICEQWKNNFSQFLSDMGSRPKGHSIERRDVNGNYEPSNCYWATPKQQGNNKRNNRFLTFNRKTQTVAQWADDLKIDQQTLFRRLDAHKWPIEKALTLPLQKIRIKKSKLTKTI